jgi:hypothetical protein
MELGHLDPYQKDISVPLITFPKRYKGRLFMGRKRKYSNAAERLKAFRERAKLGAVSAPSEAGPKRKAKVLSRPARLAAVESELQALADELQAWRDNLPESLQESSLASKLDEAIEGLTDLVSGAANIDLPKGFGRD